MTKQEKIELLRKEIRGGMWELLIAWEALPKAKRVRHHLVDDMLKFQSNKGVVIKVSCPVCKGHARPNKVTYNLHEGYCVNGRSCPNCNNTGYVAVEPLIENNNDLPWWDRPGETVMDNEPLIKEVENEMP